ncbi:MAG: hypothetical protein AAFY57_19580, partial [Cyanobacteria bacterium J06642_2]
AGMSSDGSRWKVRHDIINSNRIKAAVLKIEGTWLDWKTRQAIAPPSDLLELFTQLKQSQNVEQMRSLVRKN